jgi:predicted nucleic acid-binding protein
VRWRGKLYNLTMNGDKPSVYVETTIVSYLAARPSRDALLGAHQAITHDWWALRANYALHSSQLVQNESDAGDAEQVAKRKNLIAACSFLEITEQDLATAQALLTAAALPHKARADAVHIAVAARHKMVYLLTWNCKHIANPMTQRKMYAVLEKLGLELPYLITPEQLLEMENGD